MIKIIKAEYSYLMFGSVHTLLIIAGLFFFYKTIDVVIVNRITFMIGLLLVVQLLGARNTENRSMSEAKLPLSLKQLAVTRLIMIVFPILILYSISIIINLYLFGFLGQWEDSIFELISMCLITILFTYVYYFLTDIFSVFQTKKGRIIFESIVGIIIGTAVLFTMITSEKSYKTDIAAGITMNIMELLGIIFFTFVTIYTFSKKESHIR